jgi:hypothetical protein
MFSAKETSSLGNTGSLNKGGDHSKIEECLQIMDQMQRKVEKHEKTAKAQAKQQDAYNDLLIKYNTIVYKLNTNTVENSTIAQPNSALDHLNGGNGREPSGGNSNLRVKQMALSQSEKRIHPNNRDLMLNPAQSFSEQNQSKFVVRSKDGPLECDASVKVVEDNCENQNPNFLKDPRLVLLEDENRFLKEELKRQQAKASFYRTKFR